MSHPSHKIEPPRDALASLRIERPEETASPMRRRRWRVPLVLVLVATVCGLVALWGGAGKWLVGEQPAWVPAIMQDRVEVRLAPVSVQKGRSADAVVVATGYLESRRQAKIGARAAGRIDIINFEEGNRVKRGELLAELEHRDLDASLNAAAASVDRAKAALDEQEILIEQALVEKQRVEKLWNSRSVAESTYDQVRFAYRTAVARKESLAAEVALAEAQKLQTEQLRENMFIRAPFDGSVISKDAEVGESILPGGMGGGSGRGSVATIADLDHLEIECDVQEAFISRVTEGQEAEISVDAVQHKKYHGIVRKIIPMGDRARATIKVQVEITDADELLFPEMAGSVFFLPPESEQAVTDKPRMFCPTTAVVTADGGERFVWVVDGEKRARKIAIRTGEDRNGRTEVLEGLIGSERVVVNPEGLDEGTLVRIVE